MPEDRGLRCPSHEAVKAVSGMVFLPTSHLVLGCGSLSPPPLDCQVPVEFDGGDFRNGRVAGLRDFV